jgi:hypothetical protein
MTAVISSPHTTLCAFFNEVAAATSLEVKQ